VRHYPLLLLLLFGIPARAEPVATATPGWNPNIAAQVYLTALTFMAPRTLEPIALTQLTLWGLRGLTALDPALSVEARDGQLVLSSTGRVLGSVAVPTEDSAAAWVDATIALTSVAWNASAAVRKSGTAGILRGYFDELFNHLDPYSRYVPPSDAGDDRARRSGLAGAGITLIRSGNAVLVQSVIADGPAALAGIRAGDRIVAVDDQKLRGESATTVASWIAGPEDTIVEIEFRSRDGRAHHVELLRAMVPPETIFFERVGDIQIIRITGFSRRTDARLANELQRSLAAPHPPTGLILDLRGNRGGLLREAIAVADELLPAGIVATTAGRDPESSRVWRSGERQIGIDLPVVVIVDGRSASAAEILTAALADRGRAVVVGSVTLGKGLVQAIAPLPDGGELFLTWSRVLAPLGWPIQGLGVLPQVCTSLGQDALKRQLATLAEGSQPMAPAIARHRAARAPIPAAQALAIRDACPAAEGRETDLQVARYLLSHPAAYAAALLPPTGSAGAAP
jgi:carboxyl-terminal processing protease